MSNDPIMLALVVPDPWVEIPEGMYTHVQYRFCIGTRICGMVPHNEWGKVPRGAAIHVQRRGEICNDSGNRPESTYGEIMEESGEESWGCLFWNGAQMVLVQKAFLQTKAVEVLRHHLVSWHRRKVLSSEAALAVFEETLVNPSMHQKMHLRHALMSS